MWAGRTTRVHRRGGDSDGANGFARGAAGVRGAGGGGAGAAVVEEIGGVAIGAVEDLEVDGGEVAGERFVGEVTTRRSGTRKAEYERSRVEAEGRNAGWGFRAFGVLLS